MAIVLDINFLCNKMLNIDVVVTLLNRYNVSIESMNSIDNWMWDNEKNIESSQQFASILDAQHIIVIKLKSPLIKDMGIYIEKIEKCYFYTMWINTEGYPMLDCDKITWGNYEFYNNLLQLILEINEAFNNSFEIIGIGLETDIYYNENIIDTIQNSKNVMLWIINKHIELNNELKSYKVSRIKGICILEKSND